MKQIAILIVSILAFVSCDKLPDDKELDGMWQLTSIEKDGDIMNKKPDHAYWCFRLNLLQMSTTDNNPFFAHVRHKEDSLLLTDICYNSKNETLQDNNNWIPIEEADTLLLYGVYPTSDPNKPGRTKASYHIDELSSSRMVLKDHICKLTFRKY